LDVETLRYGAPKRKAMGKKIILPLSNIRVGFGNTAYFCNERLARVG